MCQELCQEHDPHQGNLLNLNSQKSSAALQALAVLGFAVLLQVWRCGRGPALHYTV
mgnify:CR=1 FL=1